MQRHSGAPRACVACACDSTVGRSGAGSQRKVASVARAHTAAYADRQQWPLRGAEYPQRLPGSLTSHRPGVIVRRLSAVLAYFHQQTSGT